MKLFRQIEKLQKTVNHLLGFCSNKHEDSGSVDSQPAFSDQKQARLGVMILMAQEGDLEHRYMLRLGKWLQCDEEALRYYIDFQQLSALLFYHYKGDKFIHSFDTRVVS